LVCALWAWLTLPAAAQTMRYSGDLAPTYYQGGTKIVERRPSP